MSNYTRDFTAEQLIEYIATDYVELSHDKIIWQRNDWLKICQEWLKYNLPHLDEPYIEKQQKILI